MLTRILRGFICVVGAMVFWLVILPKVARLPPIRDHIARMDAADIVTSAKFYTELNWDPPTGPVWR